VVLRLSVRIAVVLLCATGVAVSVTSRDSRIEAEKAFAYWFRTHDERGTVERIDRSRKLNPSYELDIAKARALPPAQGKAILQRKLRREPENAELWVALSVAQARLGDFAGTARSYTRARDLAPSFLAPSRRPRG
jgi:Flp pilus assembly protein TadD